MVSECREIHAARELRRGRILSMSCLLSARKSMHSKATCHWCHPSSGGVAWRKWSVSRLGLPLKAFKYMQSVARQNHVGDRVALIRGVWVRDNWRDPERLDPCTNGIASPRRWLWWCSAPAVAQHRVSQTIWEDAAAERIVAVLSSPTFSA